MSSPIIGLTPDTGFTQARPGRPALPRFELKQAYCDAVARAGGVPIVLPYVDGEASVARQLALCDGLLITGGAFDIPPALYGESASEKLGTLHPARTRFEQLLLRLALARDVPVLGVCGGMQLLAVELGGALFQDLATELPGAQNHEQPQDSREPEHAVLVEAGSLLERAGGAREYRVNTTHHQAVRSPGRARVSGRAPDGVVEAIEAPGRFVLGVQWHPELMRFEEHPAQLSIYRALVEASRRAARDEEPRA